MYEFFSNRIYLSLAAGATDFNYCVFSCFNERIAFHEIGEDTIYKAIAVFKHLIKSNRIVKIYYDPSALELVKFLKRERGINRLESCAKDVATDSISSLVQSAQIFYNQNKMGFERKEVERIFKKHQSVIDPKNILPKQKVILMAISIFKGRSASPTPQVVPNKNMFL